jgi:hypothetical protein
MDAVADYDPPAIDELATFQGDGRAWVFEEAGNPVAYLLVPFVDPSLTHARAPRNRARDGPAGRPQLVSMKKGRLSYA